MITENSLTQELEGFLLVDKPTGTSSTYCLTKIKRAIGKKGKVGHAGTLDMFATGLLIVGISRSATKHLSQAMELDKRYAATGKLGQLTDTLDLTGITLEEESVPDITADDIEEAIQKIGTDYHQVPPVYSALKHKGKHLSRLARQQKYTPEELEEIAIKKGRDISIYSCRLTDFSLPFFSIEAHVSHGTYIRTLINDIARNAGTVATTHALRRLSIGPFSVDDALPLAQLSTYDAVAAHAIPIQQFIDRIAVYQLPKKLT